jgi:hypothetical protein
MTEKNPVFAGVEIIRAAGRLRRAFVYAALDDEQQLIAIGHGDQNEVLAYLGGQQAAHVAINSPRRPNMGVVNNAVTYQEELPFEKTARHTNARLCEVLLQEEGFKMSFTPNKVKSCRVWMRRGFDLYRRLAGFGYAPFPNEEVSRHSLETHADAVFWRLLDRKNPLPNSLEGRLQRQLILYNQELPVPDAMDFFLEITRHKLMRGDLPDQDIYSIEELNALTGAFIAWQAAYHPDKIELLGDSEEGQIVLPVNTRLGL